MSDNALYPPCNFFIKVLQLCMTYSVYPIRFSRQHTQVIEESGDLIEFMRKGTIWDHFICNMHLIICTM